jgi:hypothetical protein
MDDELIKAAQRFTQISSHLSQAPSSKDVVSLLDSVDEDEVIKFLDKRVEKEEDVAEYIRAVFIGIYLFPLLFTSLLPLNFPLLPLTHPLPSLSPSHFPPSLLSLLPLTPPSHSSLSLPPSLHFLLTSIFPSLSLTFPHFPHLTSSLGSPMDSESGGKRRERVIKQLIHHLNSSKLSDKKASDCLTVVISEVRERRKRERKKRKRERKRREI